MGLRIHARKLHLHSTESILLESREESILINPKGLLLPNLSLEDVYLQNMLTETNKSTIEGNQVVPIKHRLCIGLGFLNMIVSFPKGSTTVFANYHCNMAIL